MKKLIYLLSFALIMGFIISCVNLCSDDDIINDSTRYEIHYEHNVDSTDVRFIGLEEIEPKYVAKKVNQLREAKLHKCYFENIDGFKILNIRNNEIVVKLYFKEYEDGSVYYVKNILEHFYEARNYNIAHKGFQLHSMYNGDYAADIIGDLILKTNHNGESMFVLIPFHIKCFFNLKENTTKFVIDI